MYKSNLVKDLEKPPERIVVRETADSFELDYRWLSSEAWKFLFAAIFWSSFGLFLSWAGGLSSWWAFALFLVFFLPPGFYLWYALVATLLNHSILRIRGAELHLRHAPLPWWGRLTLPVAEITQLYCKKFVQKTRYSMIVNYEVWVLLRNGQSVRLLENVAQGNQALFIEQALENTLGISDQPVAGELRRR